MKTIQIPAAGGFGEISAFAAFDVDCVCWPEQFPYKPRVKVFAAHDDEKLLLRFEVGEEGSRAVCTEPNGPVWEDSCVEFFVKAPESRYYYNFETSCIGVGLVGKRVSRQEFTHFSEDEMACITRRAALPRVPFEKKADETLEWSVELEIPFASLDCGPKPATLLANFYKCGDKTATPHFLSWSPVLTPTPDFHRPEFFGQLDLIW